MPPHRPNPSKHAFVIVIGGLLFAGLVALLALNTVLAQNAFVLHDLESRSADLQAREQSLQQDVAELAAPQRLAEKARALGMVTSENPAFIRPGDGAVLGVPKAGQAPPPKVQATPTATPAASTPATTSPAATQPAAAAPTTQGAAAGTPAAPVTTPTPAG